MLAHAERDRADTHGRLTRLTDDHRVLTQQYQYLLQTNETLRQAVSDSYRMHKTEMDRALRGGWRVPMGPDGADGADCVVGTDGGDAWCTLDLISL